MNQPTNTGKLDIKQLFAVTTMERMLQHHVYEYEKLVNYRLKACCKKFGCHLEQSTTILDLKGVSLSGFSQVFNMVKQVRIDSNYLIILILPSHPFLQ